jgi:predicted permease
MWRRRSDEDFAREVDSHIEMEVDRLIADGLDADEARAQACRRFGNVVRVQERFHDASGLVWLEQLAADLRYAWRGLRASPVFVLTTVGTLAVGLGLVSALFAVFNAYVLRPFAVRDPHSLHQIVWRTQNAGGYQFRWHEYEELRGRRDLFEDVLASTTRVVQSEGRPTVAIFVSGSYFTALAPAMRLGRGLVASDAAAPGASAVAVLTDEGWTRLFARDAAVVGREVVLNGARVAVVGVLRPEFSGLDDTPRDVILPITMFGPIANIDLFGVGQPREVGVVTRVRALTAQQLEAALAEFVTRVVDRPEPVRVEARWLATPNPLTFELLALLSPVFAAFLIVLVAASANVTNMMLARANARHREIAMRLSLGASRGRVLRLLLTEGLLIAALAAAMGITLSVVVLRVGTGIFLSRLPGSIESMVRVAPLDPDWRVFGCAAMLATGTALLFALVPALHATRLSLTHALRGEAGAGLRGSTLRNGLVVSQVAVSLVLLVSAATLVRNGMTIGASDTGFAIDGVAAVLPGDNGGVDIAGAAALLLEDPRVSRLAVASAIPFSERLGRVPLVAAPGQTVVKTTYKFVSPEYFDLLQIPIVHGRVFSPAEAAAEGGAAIVSASGARALWPGRNPIGQVISLPVEPLEIQAGNTLSGPGLSGTVPLQVTIVGVAADVVNGLLVEGIDASHIYLPTSYAAPRAAVVLVKTRDQHDAGSNEIRTMLNPLVPDPYAFEVYPLHELRGQQMFPLDTAAWIGTVLGVLALGLSVTGLYGVATYMVSQRTRELGIRVALGATATGIVRLVLAHSARLAAIGAIAGSVLVLAALRLLGAVVPFKTIRWIDPPAFALGFALVAVAAAVASWFPAWRASRVDPAVTLRVDG